MRRNTSQLNAIYYAIARKEEKRQEEYIEQNGLKKDFQNWLKTHHYRHYKMALTQFIKHNQK